MSALIASHEQHMNQTSQDGGPDSDAWKESEIHIRQLLDQTSSELVALREALSSQGPPAQEWTGMHEQLAETRKELADARAQIERLARPLEAAVQEGSSLGRDDRSEAEMAALREERDAILQERSLLEAELDHVRRRAAQLAEHLEDERRSGSEQEQHWREEFRRHRGLLEDLTSRLATLPATPVGGAPAYTAAQPAPQAAQAAPSPAPAPPQNDAALEAVRAQFELLQKEAIRRRRESK
jgi:chromosome segregation ATPase